MFGNTSTSFFQPTATARPGSLGTHASQDTSANHVQQALLTHCLSARLASISH